MPYGSDRSMQSSYGHDPQPSRKMSAAVYATDLRREPSPMRATIFGEGVVSQMSIASPPTPAEFQKKVRQKTLSVLLRSHFRVRYSIPLARAHGAGEKRR